MANADELIINTENYPPFNYECGNEIKGIATDKMRKILFKADINYKMKVLPWALAYKEALINKNTCVFSTTITPERKNKFKWVTPLVKNDWVFFAKKGSNIKLNTLEDAKKYRIGGYLDDAVALYLKKKGFNIYQASTDLLNAKKLSMGRIDLWATGSQSGILSAKKVGFTEMEKVLTFKRAVLGLACHKSVPDDMMAKMQKALNSLK